MTTSATTTTPRQLMLPGQAAAPSGPVDLAMMYVMHHAFRRDLTAFVAAARTPVGDRRTWQRLERRWQLFSTVLHHHHSGEDAGLWPLLLERADAAGDRESRATLEAMEAEHGEIDPLLASVAAGLARLAAHADEDERAALEVRLVAARERLGAHLAHEERDAMAILQRYATPEDWARVGKEHFDPAYGPRLLLAVIPWLLHRLPAEAVDRLVKEDGGRALLLLWRLVLRRPFERRERLTFRSA